MTLDELQHWYNTADLPRSLRINAETKIKDVPKFVRSHFEYLRANSGNFTFMPYYVRLVNLREIIINSQPKPQTNEKEN